MSPHRMKALEKSLIWITFALTSRKYLIEKQLGLMKTDPKRLRKGVKQGIALPVKMSLIYVMKVLSSNMAVLSWLGSGVAARLMT